ncbi:MAG: UMP kinase [Patescibacteria group bacterium]
MTRLSKTEKIAKKLFVISLGGSLIVPDEIDVQFLNNFKKLIESQTKKDNRFILITGGGKTCRKYQAALSQITKVDNTTLDWLGIYSTRFNAQLVRLMFGKLAHRALAENPAKKIDFKAKVLIAAGWEPGSSTDLDAVELAKTYGAKTVINLSNIDYLYNKDPRKFKNAARIEIISWDGLLKITGRKWVPGRNVPFDPVAAKFAQKNNLEVIIANGKNLKNLENILESKKFKGTKIS